MYEVVIDLGEEVVVYRTDVLETANALVDEYKRRVYGEKKPPVDGIRVNGTRIVAEGASVDFTVLLNACYVRMVVPADFNRAVELAIEEVRGRGT